jgi:uncharacterized metal-binding protein YceD (DUF177 family)
VKGLQQFGIDILKLSNKQHIYEFDSGDSFFENFEQSLLQKGNFKVNLILDKTETMLQLDFQINGWVELLCDRTLEPFEHPISIKQKLILKYGVENKELTDEIEMIAQDTQRINVAQYIYEYIGLSLPMKKLHPRLREQPIAEENEEGVLVYSSAAPENKPTESLDEPLIDPRWEALKKLME